MMKRVSRSDGEDYPLPGRDWHTHMGPQNVPTESISFGVSIFPAGWAPPSARMTYDLGRLVGHGRAARIPRSHHYRSRPTACVSARSSQKSRTERSIRASLAAGHR